MSLLVRLQNQVIKTMISKLSPAKPATEALVRGPPKIPGPYPYQQHAIFCPIFLDDAACALAGLIHEPFDPRRYKDTGIKDAGMAQRILREPGALVKKHGGTEIDMAATIEHLAMPVNKEEFLRSKYYKDFHKGHYGSEFFNDALKK